MMIHKYAMNDLKIVVDVNSGSIHVVEDIVYDILDLIIDSSESEIIKMLENKYEEKAIKEALNEIIKLKDEGLLFSKDIYKEKVMTRGKNYNIKALCLNIAHDCNLRCGYCFASTGDYHGGRKLMSLEVAKKAIDFLIENSGHRRRLEVDFFGGEPLLNFDVVKAAVEYGKSIEGKYDKHIGFTLTTNATLLNEEIMDFLNENMDNVVLSIDGRKNVNDKMRKTINGKGTYNIIMPKIKEFVSKRGDRSHYIRGTFTRNNLDFANDVLELADEGFKEISIEPVIAEMDKKYAILEEDLQEVMNEYENLAKSIIEYDKQGKNFRFYHYMIDIDEGPCVYKRVSSCGAGIEYFAVTPEGDLYPCHQFVGREGYLMGNVYEGIKNNELRDRFSENTVYHKSKCTNCWAKFYCSGGCQANADAFNGDLKKPYDLECKLQQKRIECAIMLKAYYSIVEK